jgi:GH15 family glucan-1,4-alpha-glucosidase
MQRIEDYGLLGDLHTAALVGRDGSIDWLCLPRFDSPACFAALLGDEQAGCWRLAPADGGSCTRRRYRGDSLILETEWDTPEGRVRVIDAMPPRGEAADVVRVVEGLSGRVPMHLTLRLRFDYGRITPWVRHHDSQLVAVAGPDAAWLSSSVPLYGQDLTSHADFTVSAGQRLSFVLTYRPSHEPAPRPVDSEQALADTEEYWRQWMRGYRYDGPWDEAVRRSSVVLKALTYSPTGGIVAAATTSLPEQLGGPRNWDYRFCWLRDATFTLQALLGTGFVTEAKAWREWLLRAVAGDPAELQIMYGIDGTRRLPEYQLDWLSGYEGSTPVRVGNAASGQFQLDVWGEVLDGLHQTRLAGIDAEETAWDLQRALLDFLEGHWDDPDNSLWEVRGDRRHFVHSKVMAWAGVDRAVQAVERFGLEGPVDRWRTVRDTIHADVCDRGWDPDRNTFTQFYGSTGLDAALLLIPQVGFLPWHDERVTGTVDAVRRELCSEGFLVRYQPQADGNVDGLPGTEGAFITCTFWLAEALYGTGRRREGHELFEHLLGLRNDLGLLSEEYDPTTGRHLGNVPQAFSHVGLVNAARHLSGTPGSSRATLHPTIRDTTTRTPRPHGGEHSDGSG